MGFTAPATRIVGQIETAAFQNTQKRDNLRFLKGLDGLVTIGAAVEVDNAVTFKSEIDDGSSGAADTIDWSAGQKHKSTLTANVTYTFTVPNGPTGGLVLRLVQDATGSRTATWPAAVKWKSGSAPTLTTGAAAIDLVVFYFDGTDYYGEFYPNFS